MKQTVPLVSAFLLSSLNKLSARTMGHKSFRDALVDFFYDCHLNQSIPEAVVQFNLESYYFGGYSRCRLDLKIDRPVAQSIIKMANGVVRLEDLVDKLAGAIHLNGSYVSLWPAGTRLRLSGGCFDLSAPLPVLIKHQAVGSARKENSMHYKIVNGRVFFNVGTEKSPHWIFRRRATASDEKAYPVLDQVG